MARIAALLILLLASFACQFKGEEKAGTLISGNQEVTNKFSIAIPAARTYLNPEVLTFTLTHPYNVTVTGTPRLELTVGSTVQHANYVSGDGTKNLVFSYTIQAGDNDADGVAVTSTVDLNGGTLTFTGTNGPDNCALGLTVPSTAGVKIDTGAPSILGLSAPADSAYLFNFPMTFSVLMSENVVITGTPRIEITVGSTTRYATYQSGSGTSTLFFRYVVANSDLDVNGIDVISPLQLNSGTIKDAAGNNSSLTFSVPNTSGVLVDGNSPYVTSITPPADGTYAAGTNLDFVFTFSEAVTVNATPSLALTVGSTARTATYQSGAGTNQLTFRHIVQSGDMDLNGITTASVFTFSGGSWIRDTGGANVLNSFSMPNLTNVIVSDSAPRITSFVTTNGTYYIGETLNFTAVFDQAVTITGTPRIPLTLNVGGPVYATYVSGSGTTNILFSYTVASGTDDNNGIVITSPFDLNGGTVRNAASTNATLVFTQPSTPSVRISGVRPTIVSVTPPPDAVYTTGQNLDFTVNFSETVLVGTTANVDLSLTIGSTTRTADYLSGSGTSSLVFRYTVVSGDTDIDGIAVISPLVVTAPAYITDGTSTNNLATVTFTPPTTTGITVNATVPTISSVTPPANATYLLNQNVDFIVNFSEAVTVTGTPTFPLTVGATARTASYVSGSGTAALTFRYTVPTNDVDTNGIASASPISGGTIKSALGVNATLTFTPPNTASVNVDGDEPTVIGTTKPANSLYDVNDGTWTFTVTFDQTVTVASGTPRIHLTVGGTTRYATYTSGTGTSTLTFVNTINSADVDLDGIAIGNSGNIDLAGATIRDASGNNANLSLNSPDVSKIFLTYANMIGWWDMDDASTVTTAACGLQTCAAQVTDKTGNGYNLTQTGTPQPEYVSNGFGTGNRGYLQFDNVNDFMNLSTIMPTIRTMIFVFQTENATMTAQDLFFSSAGGANARVQITTTGGLTYGGTAQAGWSRNGTALSANATTGTSALAAATRYILVVRFSANQTVATVQRIGNTNFGGKIAEVMTFNNGTALTDAQLTPIINYLNTKHGVY